MPPVTPSTKEFIIRLDVFLPCPLCKIRLVVGDVVCLTDEGATVHSHCHRKGLK